MLLSVVCEFSCEFDGITSTTSVTVAIEDVSGNAFDAHSLDDPLVKKKKNCISFESAIFLRKISAPSPMFESCITFLQSFHFARFPLPGTFSI